MLTSRYWYHEDFSKIYGCSALDADGLLMSWLLLDVVSFLHRLMPCNCPAQSSLCNLCYHDLLSFAMVCSKILLCKSCALRCLPCFAMPCYALSCVALLLHCLANVAQCLVHVMLCAFVLTASAKEWSRRCWESYCRLRTILQTIIWLQLVRSSINPADMDTRAS